MNACNFLAVCALSACLNAGSLVCFPSGPSLHPIWGHSSADRRPWADFRRFPDPLGGEDEVLYNRGYLSGLVVLRLRRESFSATLSVPSLCARQVPWNASAHGDLLDKGGTLLLLNRGEKSFFGEGSSSMPLPGVGNPPVWNVSSFCRVEWGRRQYIIGKEQLLEFCNSVNQGIEPRSVRRGSFYLRHGDEQHVVRGLPNVPNVWRSYLLKSPIRCNVIGLLPNGLARVDSGKRDGLLVGMALGPADKSPVSMQEVVAVGHSESIVRSKYHADLDIHREIRMHDMLSTQGGNVGVVILPE